MSTETNPNENADPPENVTERRKLQWLERSLDFLASLIGLPEGFEPDSHELEIAASLISNTDNAPKGTLYDERCFMENLLIQRVNFLFVVFSIFAAASAAVFPHSSTTTCVISVTGALICYFMALIIHRAYVKHHWLMRLFYNQKGEESHPIKFINDAANKTERQHTAGASVSSWIGRRIPTLCVVVLAITSFAVTISILFGSPNGIESQPARVIYTNSNGIVEEIEGQVSYKFNGDYIELQVLGSESHRTIFLPAERLHSVERKTK